MNDRLKEIRRLVNNKLDISYRVADELLQLIDDLFLTTDDDDRVAAWQQMYHDNHVESDKRIEELEKIIKVSKGLSCPNCDNEGFTPEQDGFGQWYQEQCEFCYTVKDSVFNRQQALQEQKP